jgi:aryl-alcohol dehydrogenase-like predicted oxidoreductase
MDMEMRKLPGTDVEVSSLCLGTMNFGQQCDEENAHAQLDYAVQNGINFIDTAEIYPIPPDKSKQGLTETYVGSWLAKRTNRDNLVLATKVGSRNQSGSMRTRDASAGLTKKGILEAIDGSLERLQTDYVDVYQVHTPERPLNIFGVRGWPDLKGDDGVPIEETLDALAEVVKSGKARYIGLSNESPWGMMQYLQIAKERNLPRIITIQNQYSLLNRTLEIGLSEMCLRENVGLLAYSSLNMGVLSGKYLDGVFPAGARFTLYERNRARYNPAIAQPAIKRYVQIAKDVGITPSQLALAFVRERAFTSSVIIAATKEEQLAEDMKAGDIQLSADTYAAIEKVYAEIPDPTA